MTVRFQHFITLLRICISQIFLHNVLLAPACVCLVTLLYVYVQLASVSELNLAHIRVL